MRVLTQLPLVDGGGRRLLAVWTFSDNPTIPWLVIALCGLVGLLVAVMLGILLYYKCCRASAAAVAPHPDDQAETEGASDGRPQRSAGSISMAARPIPPWEASGQLPPGIMLAPSTPARFKPVLPVPRQPGEPAYQRLLLVSSRVRDAYAVGRAALPNVAVLVYDWKSWTLQELLGHVKRVVGPKTRVASLAVIAPGGKAGSVSLLEGYQTSAAKLADPERKELVQFWRALSAHVEAQANGAGGRVDLLGCRVAEAPAEGAALLRALWQLTSVPFAASDDALGGYKLCTFAEVPAAAVQTQPRIPASGAVNATGMAAGAALPASGAITAAAPAVAAVLPAGQLGLVVSQVCVMDVYFDAAKLLAGAGGAPMCGTLTQSSSAPQQPQGPPPPLPPGLPPPFALERTSVPAATGRSVLAPLPGTTPAPLPPAAAAAAPAPASTTTDAAQLQASWPQLVALPADVAPGSGQQQVPAPSMPAQQPLQQAPAAVTTASSTPLGLKAPSGPNAASASPAAGSAPASAASGTTSSNAVASAPTAAASPAAAAAAVPSAVPSQAAAPVPAAGPAAAAPAAVVPAAGPAAAGPSPAMPPAGGPPAAQQATPANSAGAKPGPATTVPMTTTAPTVSAAASQAADASPATAPGAVAQPAPSVPGASAAPLSTAAPQSQTAPASAAASASAKSAAASAAAPAAPAPTAPPPAAAAAPAARPAAAAASPAAPPTRMDIFTRFLDGMRAKGFGIEALFKTFDADRSGALQHAEVIRMIATIVPDATAAEMAHLQALLDIDGNDSVTQSELKQVLETGAQLATTVAARTDTTDVMTRLREYLLDNEQVMRQVFDEFDEDKSGGLSHVELAQLVTMIPGLSGDEQKYIMTYLFQAGDSNSDGRLSFEELNALVARFKAGSAPKQPPQQQPPPLQQQQQQTNKK